MPDTTNRLPGRAAVCPDMTRSQALAVIVASVALVIVGPWLGPVGVLAPVAAVTGGSFAIRDLAAHRRAGRAAPASHPTDDAAHES